MNSLSDYLIGLGKVPQNRSVQPKKLRIYLNRLFNDPKGTSKSDSKKKIVTHSLRHTFGSNLAINGVSSLVIMRLMDHSSVQTITKYVKINDRMKQEAIKFL
ncbi:MAG: site-specific integrase [Helicobacteraceae bacterium]|nr:site-specific integrase [Helicobacteraceae bacterium]